MKIYKVTSLFKEFWEEPSYNYERYFFTEEKAKDFLKELERQEIRIGATKWDYYLDGIVKVWDSDSDIYYLEEKEVE
ncbi:MAG: hypothetical protein ACRCZ2_09190 [Fusobacteriaceae bacterium]